MFIGRQEDAEASRYDIQRYFVALLVKGMQELGRGRLRERLRENVLHGQVHVRHVHLCLACVFLVIIPIVQHLLHMACVNNV